MSQQPPISDARAAHGSLRPVVGLITATAIVVGEVIGAGIFLTPREVARNLGGAVGVILLLWLICGLVNLCGALTLAELSAMMPHAGGTYVFLREAYGRPLGFLWSWAEFWIIRSGSTAAMATGMSISLLELWQEWQGELSPASVHWLQKLLAIGAILLLTAVNVTGVHWGGAVQTLTTLIKVVFVALLGLLPLAVVQSGGGLSAGLWSQPSSSNLWVAIGGAMAVIMFTYDGWGNVTVIAEEIKLPARNVPRALAGGVTLLIVLYLGANLACHLTLTPAEIVQSEVPTVTATEKLLPGWGGSLVLAMMAVSSFGAMNGNVLVGPWVLFAAARDHGGLSCFGRINSRFGTPAWATWALSLWSVVLILAGGIWPGQKKRLFEVLVDYCTFGGSIFYLLAVLALFVLRKNRPHADRPYRTWGYPVVPAIFVVFYVFLLGGMLLANWFTSLVGLALIACGLICYPLLSRR